MKFYDREREILIIKQFIKTVENKGSRVLVVNRRRRRMGKARLVLESGQNHIYFFSKKNRDHI